jgi:fructosamine-3-kinase
MSLPPGATEVRRIGGGDINEAFHVVLAGGTEAFVKTRAGASPGEYAAEAAGLEWLAEPGAVQTPGVLDVGDDYLALQWVEHGRLDAAGAGELGLGLARTHLAGAPHFGEFRGSGEGAESGFGSLRLPNDPAEDWPTFYGGRRLLPLARLARERGALTSAGASAVERVSARLVDLVGPPEPPSRLHGDLWQGNVMSDAQGRPWLIDPSAYGGHREIDLAMLRLFGAPAGGVFEAYEEVAPLADGWPERVGLYQLLPLLVHALLFGGSYRDSAEQMALRYAG